MAINNVLAGVAVKDLKSAVSWYEQLLGCAASRPMRDVAEWRFSKGGYLQVFADERRAGSSSITLAVSSLDEQLGELKAKGISIGQTTDSSMVKTAIVNDPDGNQIIFAEAVSEDLAS